MIAIVDYGAGNLTSVRLALERIAARVAVTSEPAAILAAERVIFPGVGAIGAAMARLKAAGLDGALRETVARGTPFLGICLGAQIVFEHSEEDGGVAGLGLLPGTVPAFPRGLPGAKIPQIGWNQVTFRLPHPLFEGIASGAEFYFVHGYYPAPADPAHVLAETDYAGRTFASVAGQDNLAVTQFHPERSGRVGLKLLENFARWDGKGGAAC